MGMASSQAPWKAPKTILRAAHNPLAYLLLGFPSAAPHIPALLTHSCCGWAPPAASGQPRTYPPAQHPGQCTPAWETGRISCFIQLIFSQSLPIQLFHSSELYKYETCTSWVRAGNNPVFVLFFWSNSCSADVEKLIQSFGYFSTKAKVRIVYLGDNRDPLWLSCIPWGFPSSTWIPFDGPKLPSAVPFACLKSVTTRLTRKPPVSYQKSRTSWKSTEFLLQYIQGILPQPWHLSRASTGLGLCKSTFKDSASLCFPSGGIEDGKMLQIQSWG